MTTYTLSDGTKFQLREPNIEDLALIEDVVNSGAGAVRTTQRYVELLCTKWGDRNMVTTEQLGVLPAKDFKVLSEAAATFQNYMA